MSLSISDQEFVNLIWGVFGPKKRDKSITLITDLPDAERPDRESWADRRSLVEQWYQKLKSLEKYLGLTVRLAAYRNVRMNNAQLPSMMMWVPDGNIPNVMEDHLESTPSREIFDHSDIIMAITEYSATAPLKLEAKKTGFRAATMPGFSRIMIPALRLDFAEIDRRCWMLKRWLDEATGARIRFSADGDDLSLYLDLRYRAAHVSSGLLKKRGEAGNLPSGETYIVPYEGEIEGEKSESQGDLPVQFPEGLVIYEIEENRVLSIRGEHPVTHRERLFLEEEPAYGNLAELGLGVLGDMGLEPTGEVLLDEKLGLHIAFGRSDHFGGQVGPKDFSKPENVVHIDRVYLPKLQPRVRIKELKLEFLGGEEVILMTENQWLDWKA